MPCRYCGEETKENWNYCSNCGGKIIDSKIYKDEINDIIENEKDKEKLIKNVLSILQKNNGFVIFENTKKNKFIQFTTLLGDSNDILLCDIPCREVSKEQPSFDKMIENITQLNKYNYYDGFIQLKCDINTAFELVELFFIKVCGLGENYDMEIDYNIEPN